MLMRVAMAISKLGERSGSASLTYNPLLFGWYHRQARADAPGVMAAFADLFPATSSYVDVGAGSGAFAAQARRLGHAVTACEHSRVGRWGARCQGVDCRAFNLAADPPAELRARFDLAYCFEVAEHVEPVLGERLVEFVASQAPLAVFSAAQPGQGGVGHINEQPREYWIERFDRRGMSYRADLTDTLVDLFAHHGVRSPWFSWNTMVFADADTTCD